MKNLIDLIDFWNSLREYEQLGIILISGIVAFFVACLILVFRFLNVEIRKEQKNHEEHLKENEEQEKQKVIQVFNFSNEDSNVVSGSTLSKVSRFKSWKILIDSFHPRNSQEIKELYTDHEVYFELGRLKTYTLSDLPSNLRLAQCTLIVQQIYTDIFPTIDAKMYREYLKRRIIQLLIYKRISPELMSEYFALEIATYENFRSHEAITEFAFYKKP